MKYLALVFLFYFSSLPWGNVLIGKWGYDAEKIISELRANPKTPEKILRCFEMKACGQNTTFEYTETQWRQITKFEGADEIVSDYSEYQILEESPIQITINVVIDRIATRATYKIINEDYLLISVEFEGFRWNEYLRREP